MMRKKKNTSTAIDEKMDRLENSLLLGDSEDEKSPAVYMDLYNLLFRDDAAICIDMYNLLMSEGVFWETVDARTKARKNVGVEKYIGLLGCLKQNADDLREKCSRTWGGLLGHVFLLFFWIAVPYLAWTIPAVREFLSGKESFWNVYLISCVIVLAMVELLSGGFIGVIVMLLVEVAFMFFLEVQYAADVMVAINYYLIAMTAFIWFFLIKRGNLFYGLRKNLIVLNRKKRRECARELKETCEAAISRIVKIEKKIEVAVKSEKYKDNLSYHSAMWFLNLYYSTLKKEFQK